MRWSTEASKPTGLSPRPMIFVVVLSVLLWCANLHAGTIEGRVVRGTDPAAGIKVAAYHTLDFSTPPLTTAITNEEGLYRLNLSSGLYALFARDEQRGLFAFCGRNPVAVAEGFVWAGLQAIPITKTTAVPYDDKYSGAVEGKVLFDGEPVVGAHVYLYLDVADDLKGQGYRMSPPTGPDGRFAFDALPESGYFLVARKRENGGRVGPVREGDLLGIYGGNPLYVHSGQTQRIVVPLVRKIQQSTESEIMVRVTGMALSGRVTDAAGRPVAGVHVFAYTDRVIGHERPVALSPPTGTDGRFIVHFTQPGKYYVGAREEYGDSPMPGELFGMYEETADHGLEIRAGETRENLHLVVEPIRLE